MDAHPRLIIALDFSSQEKVDQFLSQINPQECALKVGLEMFTLLGPTFVTTLVNRGFKVFLDLKFYDIPNTVARACRVCADLGVWMLNLHASGGAAMMEAALESLVKNQTTRPLLIAVTVLTSMDAATLNETSISGTPLSHANHLAQLAYQTGLDGVVCSALEVPTIKESCSKNFLTVTPGIRLLENDHHDQKRVQTPKQAIKLGSDFLVVGRPITGSSEPQKVIQTILTTFSETTASTLLNKARLTSP
ncbi:MAG: orotidine-5'-phosphate decarboxylase [Legionella sp.]|nr:orotidine-5'-phosphate decarboxylase [Legionella sp.]